MVYRQRADGNFIRRFDYRRCDLLRWTAACCGAYFSKGENMARPESTVARN